MGLTSEIRKARKEIKTDAYAMSIGELVNLYRDREMDISPEFQRFFRWNNSQKSRFIESILLGIPLPSIFVAARDDGRWEVIDGLQRLSTVLEFMGILRPAAPVDEDWEEAIASGEREPLVLTHTKYLPSLANKVWDGEEAKSLSAAERLLIRRAKMDVKIIDRDSSADSKYELFQRLNTGGSSLSDQEVRNVSLLMRSRPRFRWFIKLASSRAFQGSLSLSERPMRERYDLELLFRFIGYMNSTDDDLRQFEDVGVFLDDWAENIGDFSDETCKHVSRTVKEAFGLLTEAFGGDGFRRYSVDDHTFRGPFSVSAFEAISVGVGYNLDMWSSLRAEQSAEHVRKELQERIERLWAHQTFKRRARSGVRAAGRVPYTVPLGRDIFA